MTDLPLVQRFEAERPRLTAVATRLLGSATDAEDAVQETWLRLERASAAEVTNLGGWLTTVVTRVCLDELKSARRRRERPWQVELWPEEPAGPGSPRPPGSGGDPEAEAVLADEVGLALLVVLDRLSPAERVALLLHDVFGYSYDAVSTVLDRSADATRQLVSRARSKVRGATPEGGDRAEQRAVVDAWLAAVVAGDTASILSLLTDDAVLTADWGERLDRVDGPSAIAEQAQYSRRLAEGSVLVRIDGEPGVAAVVKGRVASLMAFAIVDGRIAAFEVLTDMARIERMGVLDLLQPTLTGPHDSGDEPA